MVYPPCDSNDGETPVVDGSSCDRRRLERSLECRAAEVRREARGSRFLMVPCPHRRLDDLRIGLKRARRLGSSVSSFPHAALVWQSESSLAIASGYSSARCIGCLLHDSRAFAGSEYNRSFLATGASLVAACAERCGSLRALAIRSAIFDSVTIRPRCYRAIFASTHVRAVSQLAVELATAVRASPSAARPD